MQTLHNEFPISKHYNLRSLVDGVNTAIIIKESGAVCVIVVGERWFILDRSNNQFITGALRVANGLLRIIFPELLLMCTTRIHYYFGYKVFHDLV